MKKSIKNMKKVVLAIIFCITMLMPISVSAEEYSQNSSETAVQLNHRGKRFGYPRKRSANRRVNRAEQPQPKDY